MDQTSRATIWNQSSFIIGGSRSFGSECVTTCFYKICCVLRRKLGVLQHKSSVLHAEIGVLQLQLGVLRVKCYLKVHGDHPIARPSPTYVRSGLRRSIRHGLRHRDSAMRSAEAGLYSPRGNALRRNSRLIVDTERPIRRPIFRTPLPSSRRR